MSASILYLLVYVSVHLSCTIATKSQTETMKTWLYVTASHANRFRRGAAKRHEARVSKYTPISFNVCFQELRITFKLAYLVTGIPRITSFSSQKLLLWEHVINSHCKCKPVVQKNCKYFGCCCRYLSVFKTYKIKTDKCEQDWHPEGSVL